MRPCILRREVWDENERVGRYEKIDSVESVNA